MLKTETDVNSCFILLEARQYAPKRVLGRYFSLFLLNLRLNPEYKALGSHRTRISHDVYSWSNHVCMCLTIGKGTGRLQRPHWHENKIEEFKMLLNIRVCACLVPMWVQVVNGTSAKRPYIQKLCIILWVHLTWWSSLSDDVPSPGLLDKLNHRVAARSILLYNILGYWVPLQKWGL